MKKILLCLLFVVSFTSCENLIEEQVYTSLDSEALYSNEAGCDAALNGVYSNFMGFNLYGSVFPETTLNLSGLYTQQVNTIDNKFGNPASLNLFNTLWSSLYVVIVRANDVIDNVSKSDISETAKNRIVGEAHYVRAKTYFQLVRLFGAIPLKLKRATLDDIHSPRVAVDKVYEQILADLDVAKKRMPDPGKQVAGRPHKFAAFALAQKVYLTLAGNDPTSPYWQKSIDEGLAIVGSGAYTLVRPFSALWEIRNKNSKESILEIQASLNDGGSLTRMFLVSGPSSTLTPKADAWGRAKVNKEVYDLHVRQYRGDPRIDATYLDSTYQNRTTNAVVNIYPIATRTNKAFTFVRKYVDPDFLGTGSNCNFIFQRYADVLLMLAEAENELRGPAGAYAYVNQVISRARDRNGNSRDDANEIQPANWVGMTQQQFRDRIMDEYRYEFLGELDEYFLVRRRGKEYLKKILTYHNTFAPNLANLGGVGFDNLYPTDDATMTKIMLLPIPLSEISTNRLIPQEQQNPGY